MDRRWEGDWVEPQEVAPGPRVRQSRRGYAKASFILTLFGGTFTMGFVALYRVSGTHPFWLLLAVASGAFVGTLAGRMVTRRHVVGLASGDIVRRISRNTWATLWVVILLGPVVLSMFSMIVIAFVASGSSPADIRDALLAVATFVGTVVAGFAVVRLAVAMGYERNHGAKIAVERFGKSAWEINEVRIRAEPSAERR